MTASSPGKVRGSRVVYEKTVTQTGKTIAYIKKTFNPKGNIIHIKDKLT